MPLKTHPLGNNVLIEVIREDDIVSRLDINESLQRGRVIEMSFSWFHITASSFGAIGNAEGEKIKDKLRQGIVVRWEQYAEGGQTFEEEGKTYALIPWWRIISYEEEE